VAQRGDGPHLPLEPIRVLLTGGLHGDEPVQARVAYSIHVAHTARWMGGAADPETGFVYVGSTTNPANLGLAPNIDRVASRVDADYNLNG
jgi:hypothetical protein